MDKTAKQRMMESLIAFGKMFQLPTPSADYVEVLQATLHTYKWKLSTFFKVLNQLVKDDSYAEIARFGKYPMIHDYLRVKRQMDSSGFYSALGSYLSGNFWERDDVLALATPEQMNAITMAVGLSNLYARATGEKPTPVYKLVDTIAKYESESPDELIDTQHRISGPTSLQQITDELKKGLK